MTEFYLPASNVTLNESNLYKNTGFPPTTSPEVLAANGIYTVNPSADPYDPNLYTTEPAYVISGYYANQTWVATPLPLPEAKEYAKGEAKIASNNAAAELISASGVSVDIWTGAASQAPEDRPPVYNTLLNEMASIGDSLATTLTAIETATSVDEINNIIHPATGIINTGRGSGLGPEDLNPSYYVEFNSTTLTEADTELYVPGTDTVIPYDSMLPPPYIFDSMGDCFVSGDYQVQIRVAATGQVLSTFTCPDNPGSENIPF